MTEELKSSLFEGEKILWEGKPEPFELLDPVNKKSILVTWIISAAIILVFLAFYIPFYIRTGGKPTQLITGCIIVGLVPVALSIQPITTKHALDNKVLYLFTNQRAICVNNTQVNAFPLTKDTPCRIETLPNGNNVVYLGEGGCEIKPSGSRNASIRRLKTPESEDLTGMIFYSVKDAAKVLKTFTPITSISEV